LRRWLNPLQQFVGSESKKDREEDSTLSNDHH